MADFTFKLDHGGAARLLTSPEVERRLREDAQRLADAIEPQFQAHVPGQSCRVEVSSSSGSVRAGANVIILHPAALRIERKHHIVETELGGMS
jgi:hypothetical protein